MAREEDDVDTIRLELTRADEWVDATAGGEAAAGREEFEQRLSELRGVIEPLLSRYGAASEDAGEREGGGTGGESHPGGARERGEKRRGVRGLVLSISSAATTLEAARRDVVVVVAFLSVG